MDFSYKQTWGIYVGSSLPSCACGTPNAVISNISAFWKFYINSNPGTSALFWFSVLVSLWSHSAVLPDQMSILNDTWRFPRCLCYSFPCFFSCWELSSNQTWLLIQENVRQLNYTTCNIRVAFSNGCTTAFGFFIPHPEENSLFCEESPSFSLLYSNRHVWKAVLLWEWWDITSTGFLSSQNCLVSPLAFRAWNQDRPVKTATAGFCLCGGNTPLRISSTTWIPQNLILIWPILPLNYSPPPREVNGGPPWLQVSCSMLRMLSSHHCRAGQKHNLPIESPPWYHQSKGTTTLKSILNEPNFLWDVNVPHWFQVNQNRCFRNASNRM